jgi:hypothetical protein
MLLFGPEEKMNYEYSISNLATLKAFYDVGMDVSQFQSFMTDITYNDSIGKQIFQQGCRHLFATVLEYSSYENDEHLSILEGYCELGDLIGVPEYAFEIRDPKMTKIFQSPFQKEFQEFIKTVAKETINYEVFFDGDILVLPEGFAITMNSLGQFHDVAITVIKIHREMNRLFDLLVEGETE